MLHHPPTHSCRQETGPTKTHNPSGQILPYEICWSQNELDAFKGLGVLKEKRDNTYLVAYLSCWLCVFILLKTGHRRIRLETFETASLMALDYTFSLAVPVLASLYRGLNGISYVAKPFYSRSFFLCHYLYGWLAHYFLTHDVLRPAPLGPLMVCYYSGPLPKQHK